MATSTPAPTRARIKSSVPNRRVLRAINPVVGAILRSPLHYLLSDQLVLLTYTGRKTGKRYTIPVGYSREGEALIVPSAHAWWKNLRGGAAVEVRLRGRRYTGTAEPIEDPVRVAAEVERLIARYGPTEAGRRSGITLKATPPPTHEELVQALHGRALIRVTLDGGAGQGRPHAEGPRGVPARTGEPR